MLLYIDRIGYSGVHCYGHISHQWNWYSKSTSVNRWDHMTIIIDQNQTRSKIFFVLVLEDNMWMRVPKVKNFHFSAHQFIRIKNRSTILERQREQRWWSRYRAYQSKIIREKFGRYFINIIFLKIFSYVHIGRRSGTISSWCTIRINNDGFIFR